MVAICGPLLKVVSGLYCKMLLAGIYNAVDFSAEKSFQMKTAQLWMFCSRWIFLITNTTKSAKQHQLVHLICFPQTALHDSQTDGADHLLRVSLLVCMVFRWWDKTHSLCKGSLWDLYSTFVSPKPDIWAYRGFKTCVHWGMACVEPVNRVARTRKSLRIFSSKEALVFCQVNKDAPVIYFPAHIAKLMLIKLLKHTTE